jgi:RNA polymerase sigma-32 factor
MKKRKVKEKPAGPTRAPKKKEKPAEETATEAEVLDASEAPGVIEDRAAREIEAEGAAETIPKAALARVERGGEMVHLDPLTLYINEIRRHPVLPPEEEKRLTILYYENRDEDAARKVITSNLKLVVKIAFEYRKAYRNVLDLIQEGNIGLLMALKKFDPYRGVRFISYAAWWIRAYILRYILNNWRMVRIGTTQTQRKLFFNLHKERERLERMGIKPDMALIAKTLNVDEKEVVEMDRRLAATDMSLDSASRKGSGSEGTRLDTIGDPAVGAEEILSLAEFNTELHGRLKEFAATLDGKEKFIFEERLISDRPKTLQEIGAHYDITRERVRQLESRIMKKLKAFLLEQMGEYFDESHV